MKTEKTPRKNKITRKRGIFPVIFYLLSLIFYLGCEQSPPEPKVPSLNIGNAEDLKGIGSRVKGFPLNGQYTLTADVTVGGWSPLAAKQDFSGVFDGAGHTITITGGTGGLFAGMSGATVRNLKVVVTATAGTAHNSVVGGIAGYMERSVIENCTATVTLAVTSTGHNASAGGIVGTMGSFSTVRNCAASGSIALTGTGTDNQGAGLMVYAGGIAGYSGTPGLAGDGESGCVITGSRWTGGTVTATSGYPYAGGVVGYNYTGAKVERCWAVGTVKAVGANLPYAGGVAGYNSGYVKSKGTPSLIENCYSTAAVTAESASKSALAGGIAGANAKHARIAMCYARGAVTARVSGTSTAGNGGSIGPMFAASAGGIAGAQYYSESSYPNATIAACAALNISITGADSATEAVWNIYRIAGAGTSGNDIGVFTGNSAYASMTIPNRTGSVASNANGKDGADCAAQPGQSAYTGWDFAKVWQMSGGWPVLR